MKTTQVKMNIGAWYHGQGQCEFCVWAPFVKEMSVHIVAPESRQESMVKDDRGYFRLVLDAVKPETQYYYVSSEFKDKPDPCSFFQPKGVHGPSMVVDHTNYSWQDTEWKNISLQEMILYELHVGTFTDEGTFEAAVVRLDELKNLGITAVEIMPVAQFPGSRNWGYDGVQLFAVQNSYGGPEALKKFVDACHQRSIAVILDVVYNHLGPEGNYLGLYGPYFNGKYQTPWGDAINYDDADSNEVRHFFISNVLYWFEHFHIDGLRLDAVHAINDMSATPFLKELAETAQRWAEEHNRKVHIIAESDLNDSRLIRKKNKGGLGLCAQWSDDFHHALHVSLTGEQDGYYQDYKGIKDLATALNEAFVYSWKYSCYRRRFHGNSAKDLNGEQFVVFVQNHDQVGNRMFGDRLTAKVSFEALKAAAGIMFFSPYIPLLFMGEEYAEETPFQYFVDHSDKELIAAVRTGRQNEFAAFNWNREIPDPQDPGTFECSKLRWEKRNEGKYRVMLMYYQELIRLRKHYRPLQNMFRESVDVSVFEEQNSFCLMRVQGTEKVLALVNLSGQNQKVQALPRKEGLWKKVIDTCDKKWNGPGTTLTENQDFGQPVKLEPLQFVGYYTKD